MSINEIIKKYLPIKKQKLSKISTKVTHFQTSIYNCNYSICNKKITFTIIKKISDNKWHLYFNCQAKHLIIRSVHINNKTIIVKNLKN